MPILNHSMIAWNAYNVRPEIKLIYTNLPQKQTHSEQLDNKKGTLPKDLDYELSKCLYLFACAVFNLIK